MGLFDIFKKKKDENKEVWYKTLEQAKNGEITEQDFVNINADFPLYYSTPAGEDASGKVRLWLITHPKIDNAFYPAFTSAKLCQAHFTNAGRQGFMIIKGTLESLLNSLDTLENVTECGVFIYDKKKNVVLPPNLRVQK